MVQVVETVQASTMAELRASRDGATTGDLVELRLDGVRDLDVAVLIVDPIGPVLQALGVNESDSTEVGAVLWALDALVHEAGASELFVIHHAGHDGERARGTSGFEGRDAFSP